MNKDLKSLIMNLPKALLLIKKDTREVILANLEVTNLLHFVYFSLDYNMYLRRR